MQSEKHVAGRGARKAVRQKRDTNMLPALKRGIPLTEPMSPQQVKRIDNASMDILENVGVVFRDDIALADWIKVGADVRGERVHLDRGLVRELISSIPSSFTYHARNPERSLPFGNDRSIFVPMTGAPYLRDLEDKRRNPTLEDLANFHKLSHMLPAIHSSAHHIVEPYDHPISQRHLRITYSSMKHSDKTFMGMTTSPKNAEDVMDMCAILFGKEFMMTHPVVTGNANGNSPLVWDENHAGGDAGVCEIQSTSSVFALRTGRSQYASVHSRLCRATQCRSIVCAGLHAGHSKRDACDLWPLPCHRVDEVGRADGGNA